MSKKLISWGLLSAVDRYKFSAFVSTHSASVHVTDVTAQLGVLRNTRINKYVLIHTHDNTV